MKAHSATVAMIFCLSGILPALAQGWPGFPTIGGHTLGESWSGANRRLPCRATNDKEKETGELLWPQLVPDIRVCEPHDSLRLEFARDSLFRVLVQPSGENVDPRTKWRELGPWAVQTLGGEPDSVSITAPPDSSSQYVPNYYSVVAYWSHGSRPDWMVRIHITGHDGYVLGGRKQAGYSGVSIDYYGCVVFGLVCDPWALLERTRR